ncbi:cation:proton antiporter subunit C [archaeon]|nr:cation:proton antiporter subunit C [archaeon]
MLVYLVIALLLALGFYTLLFKKNLIKMIIGIALIENAVNMFLISLGYVSDGYAPIYTIAPAETWSSMVLPTPQALTLTAIVIGLASTAVMLSLAVMVFKNYKTLDSSKLGGILSE